MDTRTTLEEYKFLRLADDDFDRFGKTKKVCPRCGNQIILEEVGALYSIKCKTEGCIHLDVRGI